MLRVFLNTFLRIAPSTHLDAICSTNESPESGYSEALGFLVYHVLTLNF